MQGSLQILQSVQAARACSAPLANVATLVAPGSEAYLEGVRQRNAMLDWLFYDVGVVTHDEAIRISPWLAAEGAILVVPPTGAGELTLCASIDAFAAAHADTVHAITVAGVGSSALGAAAFARNVADAVGAPVAAVVSGYGLADVAAEAWGGFLLFGVANSIRHSFEWLDRWRESGAVADPAASPGGGDTGSPLLRSKDTRAVQALLSHPALSIGLLVGHSKGNLVISEALYGMKNSQPAHFRHLAPQLLVVTVSARIAMPPQCGRIIDVMGQLDGFGALNSRPDLGTEVRVPLAAHHTNTQLPFRLPVTATLRGVPGIGSLAPSLAGVEPVAARRRAAVAGSGTMALAHRR